MLPPPRRYATLRCALCWPKRKIARLLASKMPLYAAASPRHYVSPRFSLPIFAAADAATPIFRYAAMPRDATPLVAFSPRHVVERLRFFFATPDMILFMMLRDAADAATPRLATPLLLLFSLRCLLPLLIRCAFRGYLRAAAAAD